MKKFVFFFHGGRPTPENAEEHMRKWALWISSISHGQEVPGAPLHPTGKIISGPKGENVSDATSANDTISGYLIVEANSFDEAAVLAKGSPGLENGGTVEVKEVMPM